MARDQSLCACHQRVPSSSENMTFWLNLLPGLIGHGVTYSGPSDHGYCGCFTPCLQILESSLVHCNYCQEHDEKKKEIKKIDITAAKP